MIVELFSLDTLFTLLMLIFLQAVLGFDNLLYVTIESKRVAEPSQRRVRRLGIGLAILLRIVLLFIVLGLIGYFQEPFLSIDQPFFTGSFNVESLIVLAGGVFLTYTAIKEIFHMLSIEDIEAHGGESKGERRSVRAAVTWIVLMNLVFSVDSILSAIALTSNSIVIIISIVVSGVLMIVLADTVADFLKKNRMYEVLGLFILLIVGIMLLSEGGHKAHLSFFGYPIEPMTKSTFYFVIIILVLIDIAQTRYQRKLMRKRQREAQAAHA